MPRLWKFLKISLVLIVSVFLILAAIVWFWVRGQMEPKDITGPRDRWEANMSLEAADAAALELVSQMTLDEKIQQMHGEGFTRMMLSMFLHQTAAAVYAGENERLGIPPLGFTDGPRGVI